MGRFIKGEVVVVPFPFSDLSNSKKRPALVIKPLIGDDIILCQITATNRRDQYSVSLSSSDFKSGTLNRPSTVRTDKIFTADSNIIIKSVGHLKMTKINEIVNKIINLIKY